VVSKVGPIDPDLLVLIDPHTEEDVADRSYLERSVRHLIPAICGLAEVRQGRPIA
jgi:hypothetical protein